MSAYASNLAWSFRELMCWSVRAMSWASNIESGVSLIGRLRIEDDVQLTMLRQRLNKARQSMPTGAFTHHER